MRNVILTEKDFNEIIEVHSTVISSPIHEQGRRRTRAPGRRNATPQHHGVARLNADLLTADETATIDNYRAVEGVAPDPVLVTVDNPFSLSGLDNDLCIVAKRSGTWELIVILEGAESDNHGIARLVGDQLTTLATLDIDGYVPVEGSEVLAAGAIDNPNVVTGVDNSQVIVSKRSGVWEIVEALDTGSAQQHGIATVETGWATGDATGVIEDYRAVEGNETPGVEPATVQNPNSISANAGDQVIVSKQAGNWNAVEVIRSSEQHHGIADVYTAWLSSDPTGDIENYQSVEGSETPGAEPATVNNPNGFDANIGDQVIVSKRSGVWDAVALIKGTTQQHGVADVYAGWDAVDATGDIENYQSVEGSETPGAEPATVNNPNGLAPNAGDQVFVAKRGVNWEAIEIVRTNAQQHGIGIASFNWNSTDPDNEIFSYTPVEGDENPGALAIIQNPNGLAPRTGHQIWIAKQAGVWNALAVVEGIEQQHGIAKVSNGWIGSATGGIVEDYKIVEGWETPGVGAVSITNPNGITTNPDDQVLVSKQGGVWHSVAVLGSGGDASHGVAQFDGDQLTPGGTISIKNYLSSEGSETVLDGPVSNPNGAAGFDNEVIIVARRDGTWEVVAALNKALPEQHGIAAATIGWIGSETNVSVTGYVAIEGDETPGNPGIVVNEHNVTASANDVVFVAKRNGVWNAVATLIIPQQSNHGIAKATTGWPTTNATGLIEDYVAIEGTENPGVEPVAINNPNNVGTDTGDTVFIAKTDSGWVIVGAVSDAAEQQHGIARVALAWASVDPAGSIRDYKSVEGSEVPGTGASYPVLNNNGLATDTDDLVLVAKRNQNWEAIEVIKAEGTEQHGIAEATDGWDSGDVVGDIEKYRAIEGNETPGIGPVTITSLNSIAPNEGDKVAVAKRDGNWVAIEVVRRADVNHGLALLVGDQLAGPPVLDINLYLPVEGTETPPTDLAANPNGTTGRDRDIVVVAKREGQWRVIENITRDTKVALDAGDETASNHLLQKLDLVPVGTVPDKHTKIAAHRGAGADHVTLYSKDPQTSVTVLKDIDVTFDIATGELLVQKTFAVLDVQKQVLPTPPAPVKTELWQRVVTEFGVDEVSYKLVTLSNAEGTEHIDPTTDSCGSA